MNLTYGEVVEVFSEDGIRMGEIRVRGATKKIPLALLTEAAPGDRVLICDGVAISKVAEPPATEKENVSRDSRKTH